MAIAKKIENNEGFRKITKSILFCILAITISIICGLCIIIGSYAVSSDNYCKRAINTAEILKNEGNYPELFKWATSHLDNVTDYVITMIALYDGKESPMLKALNNYYRNDLIDDSIQDVETYHGNVQESSVTAYPRYWHGYVPIIRLLFLWFDYDDIRVINLIIQILLVFSICLLLCKKKNKLIIPYLLVYIMLMPVATAKCLQYSSCFYVMNIIIILTILRNDRDRLIVPIFLLSGILTSFFDLLTYPLVTLCIPLIIFLSFIDDSNVNYNLKTHIRIILKASLAWAGGYIGMWFGKWLIVTLLTDNNLIVNAINQIFYRMGTTRRDGEKVKVLKMIVFNMYCITKNPASIISIALCIWMCIRNHQYFQIKRMIPYIFISLFPFFWYILVKNHSDIHTFMTHKILVISYFSALCYLLSLNSFNKKN